MQFVAQVDTGYSERHCAGMFIFIMIVLVAVTIFGILRYVAFTLSNGIAGQLTEIRAGVEDLGRAVGTGLITAVAADCIVLPTWLLGLLPNSTRSAGTGTPVLMVHGLYHNKSAWILFKRRLRAAGFTNLHTYQYNSFTKDFDTAMAGMEVAMDEVLSASPDGRVILVGHSLGGLVCRCAAGNPAYRNRVAAIVTLGSPHKGSDLGWLGSNKMARDLIPGRYIPQTVENTPDPDCPRFSIYTLTDDYVFPLSMLRTGRPGWRERVCAPMGHVWMLYADEVAGMTIDFLKEQCAKEQK